MVNEQMEKKDFVYVFDRREGGNDGSEKVFLSPRFSYVGFINDLQKVGFY